MKKNNRKLYRAISEADCLINERMTRIQVAEEHGVNPSTVTRDIAFLEGFYPMKARLAKLALMRNGNKLRNLS